MAKNKNKRIGEEEEESSKQEVADSFNQSTGVDAAIERFKNAFIGDDEEERIKKERRNRSK